MGVERKMTIGMFVEISSETFFFITLRASVQTINIQIKTIKGSHVA